MKTKRTSLFQSILLLLAHISIHKHKHVSISISIYVLFFSITKPTQIQVEGFGIPFLRKVFSSFGNKMNTAGASILAKSNVRNQLVPDPDLSTIHQHGGISSIQDIQRKIHEIRILQNQYTNDNADLYQRQWAPTTLTSAPSSGSGSGPSSGSSSSSGSGSGSGSSSTLSVLQFNTLAQGLSAGPIPTPFDTNSDHDNTNSLKDLYGGFTDIPHPEVTLDFQSRKWRLVEVLLGADIVSSAAAGETSSLTETSTQHEASHSHGCGCGLYDVIAMEEVDQFNSFFEPLLNMLGYQGLFVPKPHSPCVMSGWFSDGCALFWKSSVLELVNEGRYSYQQGNQVYLILTMRHLETGKIMIFAVTHLKAGKGVDKEVLRTAQVKELMQRLESSVSSASRDQGVELNDIPVILMGDFNSDIREEESCIRSIIVDKEDASTYPWTSAYEIDPPDSSLFTTWKIRGDITQQRIIDYIFYNAKNVDGFECTHILDVPNEDELEPTKLPGFKYPSDHLAIGAKFRLTATYY